MRLATGRGDVSAARLRAQAPHGDPSPACGPRAAVLIADGLARYGAALNPAYGPRVECLQQHMAELYELAAHSCTRPRGARDAFLREAARMYTLALEPGPCSGAAVAGSARVAALLALR